MSPEAEELSRRITEVGDAPPYLQDYGSLLHAYIACLSFEDLCDVIVAMISEPSHLRLALRNRLLRLLRESDSGAHASDLISLLERTSKIAQENRRLRQFVDALHSAVFEFLPLPAQHEVLTEWMSRGKRVAAGRWLNAIRIVPSLFDANAVAAYWRASDDWRAAKALAYQAPPDVLQSLLVEIVERQVDGWIVSKAALRATYLDEPAWEAINRLLPSTYLYLSAKLSRPVSDEEAFRLAMECAGLNDNGGIGLAIWSIGQMRKIAVLDRLREEVAELENRRLTEILAAVPKSPPGR